MTQTLFKTTIAALAFALVVAFAYSVTGTAAAWYGYDRDATHITNGNNGSVTNNIGVGARTGNNHTDGGKGGAGGAAESWLGSATGGKAGNAGNAAAITSGNATAFSGTMNQVNYNDTVIREDCECDEQAWWDVNVTTVTNRNMANVRNTVDVNASTGGNSTGGGAGGEGGYAGAAGSLWYWWYNPANADAGAGGAGGEAGTIRSGTANARSEMSNVVNTNVTRIVRGGSASNPD